MYGPYFQTAVTVTSRNCRFLDILTGRKSFTIYISMNRALTGRRDGIGGTARHAQVLTARRDGRGRMTVGRDGEGRLSRRDGTVRVNGTLN